MRATSVFSPLTCTCHQKYGLRGTKPELCMTCVVDELQYVTYGMGIDSLHGQAETAW